MTAALLSSNLWPVSLRCMSPTVESVNLALSQGRYTLARVTSRSRFFGCTPSQFAHLLEQGIFGISHLLPFRLPVFFCLFEVGGSFPPTFAEEVLSAVYRFYK